MESVPLNPAFVAPQFVEAFRDIVEKPEETVYKFTTITPTHTPGIERNYWWIGIGVISAIFALVTGNYHYKKSCLSFAALALTGFISFYNSSKTIQVPTELYTEQCTAIRNLFDPCIKGLNAAKEAKDKTICAVFQGELFHYNSNSENDDLANEKDLTKKVNEYSQKYDKQPGNPLQAEEETTSPFDIKQQAHFRELFPLATILSKKDLTGLPKDVSDYAKDKYNELKKASTRLVHGYEKREDKQSGDDLPYVYIVVDKGIPKLSSWDRAGERFRQLK